METIKAVFTDADGTLLDSEKRVMPRTLEAVRSLNRQGIPFVIMSGRSPQGIYMISEAYGFSCCAAAFSGGLVLAEDRSVLYSSTFSQETAAQVIGFIESRGFDCAWCIFSYDDIIVKDRSHPRVQREMDLVGLVPDEGDVSALPAGQEVHKILGMCGEGTLDEIQRQVADAFPQLTVTRSTQTYLEVMPAGVCKGDAVRLYCQRCGIDPVDTAAFGDQYNDISMLQAVGHPFLMGNAPESLKELLCPAGNGPELRTLPGFSAPVRLTADCDHEGLAEVLTRDGSVGSI